MNQHKSQSIQIAQDFEAQKITSEAIRDWISRIILKSAVKEPWMEHVYTACDSSDLDIMDALNAVPFFHPDDQLWEIMLRKPLIPGKTNS